MTVPIENINNPTEKACMLDENGKLVHIPTKMSAKKNVELEYHGIPVDSSGSVVTYYYGYDIISMIEKHTNFKTQLFFDKHDLIDYGIMGEFKDVIICIKK